jgi:hypothetical protein
MRIADALGRDRVRTRINRVRRDRQHEFADDGVSAVPGESKLEELIAAEVARQLAPSRHRDFTLGVLLGGRVRTDRTLTRARYTRLMSEIVNLTGSPNVEWQTQQAFRSLLDLEARGLGRVAGSTYNVLGKLTVPPLLNPAEGPVLEIGTLYGLFSPALIRSFRRAGDFRMLTVIDPFAGLQVQGGANLRADRTGTPVDEDVARWNFGEFGLAADEVRVIPGYSTDPTVQQAAADEKYGVVVIDGDHSEAGVQKDLWWVENITAPGGVVVMDDYGDSKWPGVEAATRRYLADGGRLVLLGTASTSAYLRMPAKD